MDYSVPKGVGCSCVRRWGASSKTRKRGWGWEAEGFLAARPLDQFPCPIGSPSRASRHSPQLSVRRGPCQPLIWPYSWVLKYPTTWVRYAFRKRPGDTHVVVVVGFFFLDMCSRPPTASRQQVLRSLQSFSSPGSPNIIDRRVCHLVSDLTSSVSSLKEEVLDMKTPRGHSRYIGL